MSSSSTSSSIGALEPEATSCRDKANALRTATHDGELLRVIESTMQSTKRSLVQEVYKQVEEIPSDFPFKIHATEGLPITLTRSLRGEQIRVHLVSTPTLDQDEEEDQGENSPQEQTVPLIVTVSKDDGSSLVFVCTAYPDKFVINSLSMTQPDSGIEEDEYAAASYDVEDEYTVEQVYKLSELEQNLQQELYKYLELRGITPLNTKILHDHMIRKDWLRYRLWLARLSDFVKKD